MRVIVTDVDDKKAVAAIRALGREGVTVCAAGVNRWSQGLYSRYTSETLVYPNPVTLPDEYAAFMLDYVSHGGYDCLLPMSDYTCLAASKHIDEFSRYVKIPVPDLATARLARDKLEMIRLAERLGIGVPKTYSPTSADDLKRIAGEISYPCVVKFRKGAGAVGITYPNSSGELLDLYQMPKRPDTVFENLPPLIQEYIPGDIHDVCTLCNHGKIRAALTHVRVKTRPAGGGYAIMVRTTDEPELKEKAFALLREIGWHGPAQVEFKIDSRDNQPKLMEINARFWGSTDEMVRAGINVFYMAVRMAVEGDVEQRFDYPIGLVYRWPFPHLFTRIWSEPNVLKALREFVFPPRGAKSDIQLTDPMPNIVAAAHATCVAFRRSTRT